MGVCYNSLRDSYTIPDMTAKNVACWRYAFIVVMSYSIGSMCQLIDVDIIVYQLDVLVYWSLSTNIGHNHTKCTQTFKE
ncbi:hypothetical protein A1Q_4786 [Vibrio campbellii HY01]|nr:hypothetical protein A1Q_4786 [Vibrio campbellii HY01]